MYFGAQIVKVVILLLVFSCGSYFSTFSWGSGTWQWSDASIREVLICSLDIVYLIVKIYQPLVPNKFVA